jgi:hypothetical protein
MRQKGQNLNSVNSNQQWAKDARDQYAKSRFDQATRAIQYKGADNLGAYAEALRDIGAAGGGLGGMGFGREVADDFLTVGKAARDAYRKQAREEELEEMELEAGRLKLTQAREAMRQSRTPSRSSGSMSASMS